MFSPSVISEGIFNDSSISEPSVTGASVKKKTPRELRSCVNPTPSTEVPGWRSESGSKYGNRCPTRRSIPAGGVVISRFPCRIAASAGDTLAHSGPEEKFEVTYRQKYFQIDHSLALGRARRIRVSTGEAVACGKVERRPPFCRGRNRLTI